MYIDYSTPTMTLAVGMQINALACNAGLREGSLPTSPNSFPQPESNSFPKLRLVDFYSHHATPPLTVVPCQRIYSPILVHQEKLYPGLFVATVYSSILSRYEIIYPLV